MSNGILVFVEHRQGAINKVSFEAVAAAQQLGAALGQEVTAVVLGADAGMANEVTGFRLAGVLSAENAKLADYTPDAYADVGVGVGRVVGELGVLCRQDAGQPEARDLVRHAGVGAEDDRRHLLPQRGAQLLRRRHGLERDFVDGTLPVLDEDKDSVTHV